MHIFVKIIDAQKHVLVFDLLAVWSLYVLGYIKNFFFTSTNDPTSGYHFVLFLGALVE